MLEMWLLTSVVWLVFAVCGTTIAVTAAVPEDRKKALKIGLILIALSVLGPIAVFMMCIYTLLIILRGVRDYRENSSA